jgi:predicted O-methyltransferase YrrM
VQPAASTRATGRSYHDDPKVCAVLERLHAEARGDALRFLPLLPSLVRGLLGRDTEDAAEQSRKFKDVYIPVSREQGAFMYLAARAIGARNMVEFGTSFGISTIYLAAAARESGGRVIGSELEPGKHRAASAHLAEAGLADWAEVRLGDARETLRSLPEPIDLVLLDGWKDLYLPILKLLEPRLRSGSIVLADNVSTFRRALAPYVAYVRSGASGFRSVLLPFRSGFEFSVKL